MKKLIALLLALSLLAAPALAEPAAEESAPLTYEELEIYLSSLQKAALNAGDTSVQEADGVMWASCSDAMLQIADETLTENTAVLGAVVMPGQEDLRGLALGATLDEVLAAYPNDNPLLSGSAFDAALYIRGEKPEVSFGYLLRDGQRITRVCYAVAHWTQDGVLEATAAYTLDQGVVTDIRITDMQTLTEEAEALETLADIAAMQETSEYYDYSRVPGLAQTPFQREDLSFSGIDFLDLTAESAIAAFGDPIADQWTEDSTGEWIRMLLWSGLRVHLLYDANKAFLRPDSLIITDPDLEGPRGVRAGDYSATVTGRFPQEEGSALADGSMILYGDGVQPPYGLLSDSGDSVTITYALRLDGNQTVLLYLVFTGGELLETHLLLR